MATRSTHSIPGFVCFPELRGDLRGCQGRPEGAFLSTLDSPASHITIELGTKRNAVQ
jgi:hypothetical protein